MADGFDAYFKWLGIPPAEQPPSHYRLLGVPELVDDPDVIESAADQRMSHLRGLQTGKNAAHAQRLLNEVSQARVCLLNAEQKRAYDQRLRSSKPDVPKGKPPAAVPMSAESPLAAPAARPAPLQINTQGNQRGRAIWMHPAVLGLAMAGVVGLMLVVVVLWMRGGSGNEVAQNAPPGNDTPTAPNDDASPMESPAAKEANEAESQENGNPSGVAARGNPIDTPPADPAPAANENSPPAPPADSPSVDQAPADPAPAEPPPSPDPSPADPMPVTPAVGETRPSAPAESTADARLAIPSDEQQVKAFASINEVFDFAAAEAPPQQLKIAGELLAFGKKSQNNPAEKFVLLREAMRLAKAGGDARLMLQAIDEIGGDFEIDAPAVRQKMLIGFADEARQAESIRSLVEVFEEFADQALEEQRFEAAAEAAAAVYAAVQRAPGSKYRKEVYDRRKQIVQLYENWQEIQSALAAVKTNPDDAAANLKLGRWYCFEQRDWRAGLPYLAKGSDAQLQSLAKLELDSPAGDADAQLALADAWYAAAETAPREAKTALLARSGHWYQQAQGSFTSPVVKLKIEKRLEEIGQLLTLDSPAVASPTLPVAATPDGPIAVALKYRATLSGHTHTVHGIEFSPDGKALLTFCKDRSVRLWDLAAGRPLKTLSTNLQDFSRGRMSADGQAIAAANLDHSISVWKADSPAPMILRGHTGPVTCVAFSGDGKTIASASEDGTAKLWEVKTGKGLKSFADSDGGKLKSVALSSDGKTLLTAMDVLKTVKRWDVDSGEVAFTIKTGSNNFDVVFGPQEKHIISISYNHPLQIWNAENGELVAALSGHPGYPRAARVSPDGRLLAEARHEGTIRIWDLTTYKELTSTPGHDQAFEAAFSPDGKTLASGGHDQIVKLWDVEVTPLTSKAE